MVGQRFGRLVVLSEGPRANNAKRDRQWLCRCDCGVEKLIRKQSFLRNAEPSCGCLTREKGAEFLRARNTKHGQTRKTATGVAWTPTYGSWRAMVHRCTKPSDSSYARYGGAGVTVCERWLSFDNFRADMGERPEGMTLDRIDNAKGYEPANVRWATARQQQNNRTMNHVIEYAGRSMTLTEWARELGISNPALQFRLDNWPIEKALSAPRGNAGPR